MLDLATLTAAVEQGDRRGAVDLVGQAIAAGAPPQAILDAMTGAMATVGARFSANEIFVPEMLVSARAMNEALAVLETLLVSSDLQPSHTAVIGTIQGDLHDIGKNLVAMMWKGANVAVVDLGTNVAPDRFVDAARESNATVVAVSALLTTTMAGMKDVVAAVHAALPGTPVIVGGAPVTKEFADQIGADGFAPDAGSAVALMTSLIGAVA
jgi:5-methyltetrahydrofolate--homocysteine methyltransferase